MSTDDNVTPLVSEAAHAPVRRCVPLFRPHRWTSWAEVAGTIHNRKGSVGVTLQARRCTRCGRIQVDDAFR